MKIKFGRSIELSRGAIDEAVKKEALRLARERGYPVPENNARFCDEARLTYELKMTGTAWEVAAVSIDWEG